MSSALNTHATFDVITHKVLALAQNTKPRIILGLSGGPDSMFLLHVLTSMHHAGTLELVAAHLDHGWRTHSARDVAFCQEQCAQRNVPFIAMHARELPTEAPDNGSQEARGRALRRFFFEQIATEHNAQYIALGHHLDDQIETFLWRIMRGATLSGLTCMHTVDGKYLRPLLECTKQEILDYLMQEKIPYLIDETNQEYAYLRNRIRKEVVPALRACDERFDQKFSSTLNHLQAEDAYLQELTHAAFTSVFEESFGTFTGYIKAFRTLHPVMQRRLVLLWLIKEQATFTPSSGLIEEIIRFLCSPRGGTHEVHESWLIVKRSNMFWIVHLDYSP